MTTHRIAVIPEFALGRPSAALIILHGVLLSHHVAGRGISFSPDDVAAICEALGEIVPAVQALEAAAACQIATAAPAQPSADIVFFRPRQHVPMPHGDGAA